ncbi:hypothetical protein ACFOJ6_20960 [Gordonia humi]|uniref:hypothetical protein n=1 Tax=Gordonia humi TaxID=686429 RepID=UPI003622B7C2
MRAPSSVSAPVWSAWPPPTGTAASARRRLQLDEVVDVDLDDDEPGESDEEWFFPQAK